MPKKACVICGQKNYKHNKSFVEKHHISYDPVAIVSLCRTCHKVVTRYERGSTEDWDDTALNIIAVYKKIDPNLYISEASEVVSTRVTHAVYSTLRERASARGKTLSDYLNVCIVYIVNNIHEVDPNRLYNHIGIPNGKQPVTSSLPPMYNKALHKPGDRVRIRQGNRMIEAIVPDVDADGYVIYE